MPSFNSIFFPGNIHRVWNMFKLTTLSLIVGIQLEGWIILREIMEKSALDKIN